MQGNHFLLENLWSTDVSKLVQGSFYILFPQKFDTVVAGTQRLVTRITLTPESHKWKHILLQMHLSFIPATK